MSADFRTDLIPPESFHYGVTHHRYGVPVRILTKAAGMPYSPNYLYLYTHLYHMDLRNRPMQLKPEAWHWKPDDPYHRRGNDIGRYAPYSTGTPGVHSVPCPQGISWMLKDEFGCEQAEYHPFWRIGPYAKLNDEHLRASLWLRPGKAALFVVSNFSAEPTQTELSVDLSKLGLEGKPLRVYDAWTDDEYRFDGSTFRLTIPGAQYRFIRLEPMP
jgi:hypothetical protein